MTAMPAAPDRRLGLGIGWRPETDILAARPKLGFVEAVAESVDPRRPPAGLLAARDRGMAVIPHGISLSLGGAERPDPGRLTHLAAVAERLGSPLVSEHIAFVRAGGQEAGHLLPVPRTREALAIMTENVVIAQQALPVPLALEHVATLVEWPGAEYDEAAFVTELLDRTGAELLLDLSNLYANAHNHGYDAREALTRFPLARLAYVHVGGGFYDDHGVYHDTHGDPVVPGVLDLVEELLALTDAPGLLLERDDNFSVGAELATELDDIAAAARRGSARREGTDGG